MFQKLTDDPFKTERTRVKSKSEKGNKSTELSVYGKGDGKNYLERSCDGR